MNRHVMTVLGFMTGAQTILALYGSPDGPTDPTICYNMLVELLEAPALLAAQMALAQDHNFVMLFSEPSQQVVVCPDEQRAYIPAANRPGMGD